MANIQSIITNGNGNVLIGTTTDSGFKLDVNGTGRFSASGNSLRLNSTSNDVWATFIPQTGHVWRMQARTTSQFSVYNENLGIFPFTIESTGAATFSSILSVGFDSNNRSTIRLTSNAANRQAAIYFYGNNVESAVLGYEGGSEIVGSGVQGDFVIRNLLANKNIILTTNAGNVGIGTTAPASLLTVNGLSANTESGQIRIIKTGANEQTFHIGYNTTSDYAYLNAYKAGLGYKPISLNPDGGNVLIGTTTDAGYKLNVNGSIYATGAVFDQSVSTNNSFADANNSRILKPNGGASSSGTPAQSGAIRITYPVGWTNTMHRVKVNVYEYATNESFTIYFGGYNYEPGGGSWNNCFAYILNQPSIDRNFNVRFGYDGTYLVVYIGELASSWTYPQVFIEEVECGFGGLSDTWKTGAWSIGYETSAFLNIGVTISNPQSTNLARSGSNAYYNFGNVGIGTDSFADVSFGDRILKVYGTRATLGLTSTSTLATISMMANSDTTKAIHMNMQSTGQFSYYQYSAGAVTFSLSAAGNTLLGTETDSGFKLDVYGTAYIRDITRVQATNTYPLRIISQGGPVCRVSFQDPDNASNDAVWVGSRGFNLCFGSNYSEQARISTNGAFLIGTTTDSGYKLSVAGGSVLLEYTHGLYMTNSVANVALLARVSDTSGIVNFAEYAAAANINGYVIGSTAAQVKGVFADNKIEFFTSAAVKATLDSSGNFGIGTVPSATIRLHVLGDTLMQNGSLGVGVNPNATDGRIDASNDIVAFSTSDSRLKENITPIPFALEKVKALTGVMFDWKEETKAAHGHSGRDTGVIAQEVQAVMPTAVRTNDTGYLAVRYEKLIGLLIEANKELAERVEQLEKLIK